MKTLMLDAIFHFKFNNVKILDPNFNMLQLTTWTIRAIEF
jgi:hypothetical protein